MQPVPQKTPIVAVTTSIDGVGMRGSIQRLFSYGMGETGEQFPAFVLFRENFLLFPLLELK